MNGGPGPKARVWPWVGPDPHAGASTELETIAFSPVEAVAEIEAIAAESPSLHADEVAQPGKCMRCLPRSPLSTIFTHFRCIRPSLLPIQAPRIFCTMKLPLRSSPVHAHAHARFVRCCTPTWQKISTSAASPGASAFAVCSSIPAS